MGSVTACFARVAKTLSPEDREAILKPIRDEITGRISAASKANPDADANAVALEVLDGMLSEAGAQRASAPQPKPEVAPAPRPNPILDALNQAPGFKDWEIGTRAMYRVMLGNGNGDPWVTGRVTRIWRDAQGDENLELDTGHKIDIKQAGDRLRHAPPERDEDVAERDRQERLRKLRGQAPAPAPVPPAPALPAPSKNTIFTDEAAAAARALLKRKLGGTLNSGIDPEVMQAGITLAGHHIEKGARSFAAYVKAMLDDMGDLVRPYLKSWYMGVKYDPRAAGLEGMSSAAEVDAADVSGNAEEAATPTAPAQSDVGSAGQTEQAAASSALADKIKTRLNVRQAFTWRDLFAWADEAFGGTQAEGKYTPKDAYDALEMGVNRFILAHPEFFNPADGSEERARLAIARLTRAIDLLPTQTKRTAEQDEFQQFSTVPPFAFIANWVAAVGPNDVMLEPSGGLGGLAVFSKNAGATVIVNELSPRRAELLAQVLPDARLFTENAEQLDNILPADVKPTVVVMNPPFSASAGRMQGRRDTMIGARHVSQAMDRLESGGRLVAIVGEGMALDKPAFRSWWADVRAKYDVRAVIPVDGKGYAKYGTTFDNVILVIDKRAPQGRDIVTTKAEAYTDLVRMLAEIRNDRGPVDQPAAPAGAVQAGASAPAVAGGQPSAQPAGVGGRAGSGQRRPVAAGGARRSGQGGDQRPAGNAESPGSDAGAPAGQDAARSGDETAAASGGPDSPGDQPGLNEAPSELGNSVFESYRPQRLQVPGAKAHPGALVQSAAMASVLPPPATYKPNLPAETISEGKLSIAQLEAVTYAGQAFEQIMPNGERRGFFIGDGTGVGKGREISGVLLDNLRQGRMTHVWVSEKQGLMADAKRDFGGVGGDPALIFNQNKTKADEQIQAPNGILFTTYSTLRSGSMKQAGTDAPTTIDNDTGKIVESSKKAGQSRLDQLVNWLGQDFDGVLVFDEAHNAGNAIAMKGERGFNKPSEQALAVVSLQKKLPKARVLYVSATGATQVSNLSYATRLGLWGEGTPFASPAVFINQMTAGGLATMELVARDMKQMGAYIARSLSFEGVTYARLEHELTPLQRDIYDRLAEAWQVTLRHFLRALEITGAVDEESGRTKNSRALAAAKSAYWGAQQRFFNQIITSMQMPTVIEQMERDIAEGSAVVAQLVNTNEAQQERALARRREEGEEELEDLDLTPRDQLIQMVQKSFPVVQMEDYLDEDGRKQTRPVLDSQGNPVLNKQAVQMRDKLIDDLQQIRVPDGPLEMLLNHFGPDVVAEVTGRGQRVVRKADKDGNVRAQVESRGASAARADAEAFMANKKRILVFSDAGGTGFSFHADKTKANQRKRQHYLLQPGWRADKAVQGMGRSHRTNQASEPNYRLAATDVPAHKRFLSAIARRLDMLGALTKGQRDTANQGLFSEKDNLESVYAQRAVRRLIDDSRRGQIQGMGADELLPMLGLEDIVDKDTGSIAENKYPSIQQFLNRLLSLKLSDQSTVFDAFTARMEEQIDLATQSGELDTGMETIRALSSRVVNEETVYTDPRTGAETKLIELELTQPTKMYPFPSAKAAGGKLEWLVNEKSGRVWGRILSGTTTKRSGDVVDRYRMMGTNGTQVRDSTQFPDGAFREITAEEARRLWDAETAARPETYTETTHMIVGAVLPIWDRIDTGGTLRVVRTQTSDGRRLLGRRVADDDLADVRKRLSLSSKFADLAPQKVMERILAGSDAELANGWTLKRSRVSGDWRIELMPGGYLGGAAERELTGMGILTERINWASRFFVPVGERGATVLQRLLASKPLVDLKRAGAGADGDVNLSLGDQRQTDTPEFRRWFGDSKVVDAQGRPRIVYHGTGADFSRFNTRAQARGFVLQFGGPSDVGSWFGSEPSIADVAIRDDRAMAVIRGDAQQQAYRSGGQIMPVYLSLQNPRIYADYDAFEAESLKYKTGKGMRNALERQGFDGIVIERSTTDGAGERSDYVAFLPEQIKSAVGNRGTFDPDSPDIRMRVDGADLAPDTAQAYATASDADQRAVRRLQARMARYIPGLRLDAAAAAGGRDAGQPLQGADRARVAAAELLRALTGRRAVYFRSSGGPVINGVHSSLAPDVLFLRHDATRPHMAVLGHEFLHGLRQDRPDLYDVLRERMRLVSTRKHEPGADLQEKRRKLGLAPLSADALEEEFLADVMGDSWMDAAFWKSLAGKEPNTPLRRAFTAAMRFVDDVLRKIADLNPFGTNAYLSDIKAARAAMAQALRDYVEVESVGAPAADLNFSAGSDAPWYSALAREIGAARMNVAGPAAWQQIIDGMVKAGKVKADEVEWSGVREWLGLQQGKVTREAVSGYLRDNGVRVQETVMGGGDAFAELDRAIVEADALGFTFARDVFEDGDEYTGRAIQFQRRRDGVVFGWNGRNFVVEDYPSNMEEDSIDPPQDALIDVARDIKRIAEEEQTGADADGTKYSQYTLPGGPLSRDTEILSRDGWLRMDEVQVGDIVMTRRDEDGRLEWQEVEAVPTVFADKLYHFKNQSIDMRVTACHNMLVKRRRRSSGGLFRAKAADLWSMAECVAPLVGEWHGEATADLYGYRPEDAAELIGWYIAEGSAVSEGGKKSTLSISQCRDANPEKCARIEALLNRMGIAWSYVASGPAYFLSIKTMDRGLVEVLHAQGDSRNKFVPGFILSQPPAVLRSLMDGMLLGDGHLASVNDPKREPRWAYFTNCKRLADDMQTLALLCGLRATIGQRPTGLYEVRLNSKQWASIDDAKHAIVDYNDTAFCVTVKNHAIYVRTGGVAAFTGNSNYREVLLTLPPSSKLTPMNRWAVVDQRGNVAASFNDRQSAQDAVDIAAPGYRIEEVFDKQDTSYRSRHWDQPNVLAHIRVNDRTDADGRRVLFVEEIQSDWAQEGKKRGWFDKRTQEAAAMVREGLARGERPTTEQQPVVDGLLAIRNAPFVDTTDKWVGLAIKRVIKMAVDEGYDRVAFVTGEQSAERYDLSKQVDAIGWWRTPSGEYGVAARRGGNTVLKENFISLERVRDVLGKDIADKIEAGVGRSREATMTYGPEVAGELTGLDLKVGGEGMRAFYDKIVPAVAKDVLRKLGGGAMEAVDLGTSTPGRVQDRQNPDYKPMEQPGFTITQAMRDKAAGGMPMFSMGGTVDTLQSNDTARRLSERVMDVLRSDSTIGVLGRTVGTPYHLAHAKRADGSLRNPDLRKVYDEAQDYLNDINTFANDPANLAPRVVPMLNTWRDALPASLGGQDLRLAGAQRSKLARALFEGTLGWTRDDQGNAVQTDDPHKGIEWTGTELRQRFGFNDADVKLYEQTRAAIGRSLDLMAGAEVARQMGGRDLPEGLRAMVSRGDTGRFKGLVLGFLTQQVDAAESAVRTLKAEHREQLARFAEATPGPDTEAMRDALKARQAAALEQAEAKLGKWKSLQAGVQKTYERVEDLKDRGYMPLMRFGPHTVTVRDIDTKEVVFFGMYETQAEANVEARKLRETAAPNEAVSRGEMSQEQWRLFKGMSPETVELFGQVAGIERTPVFEEYIRRTKANHSALKRLIQRKGTPGFSEDVQRVLAAFLTSNARAAAANLHAGAMEEATLDIDQERGLIKDYATKLTQYVQNPTDEAQAIRGLMFVQFIGGSVASAMVNMTQPFTMTLPWLSQHGGPVGAARLLTSGMRAALTRIAPDSDLGKAMARAEKDGIVSPQALHELQGQAVNRFGRTESALRAMGVSTKAAEVIDASLRRVLFAWGGFFSLAEQFNRRSTFIAAYQLATEQRMADPFAFAAEAVSETQGVYNRGNRPQWARGPVGATVMTFKQFSIAYVEFLSRLPRREKAIALGVLVIAAGLEGLPFADDLDDLIDTIAQRLFGKAFSAKRAKVELLSEVLGRDGAEWVLRGASALPGFPVDLAGRMSLGNMIPGTGLLRTDGSRDKSSEVLEALGPAGGVLRDALRGEFLPVAARNAVKAAEMARTGQYRDELGRKVADVDGADAVAKGLGFQPREIARESRDSRMAQSVVAQTRAAESEIVRLWAQGIVDGEPDKVTQAQEQLAAWNQRNPDARIAINRVQIARMARDMRATREDRVIRAAPKELRGRVAEELR